MLIELYFKDGTHKEVDVEDPHKIRHTTELLNDLYGRNWIRYIIL